MTGNSRPRRARVAFWPWIRCAGDPMPLVDLDDPEELRARWTRTRRGRPCHGLRPALVRRRRWVPPSGRDRRPCCGWSGCRRTLEDGRAVLFGFHTQHSRTAGADLLAGSPDWIGLPEVRRRQAPGRAGIRVRRLQRDVGPGVVPGGSVAAGRGRVRADRAVDHVGRGGRRGDDRVGRRVGRLPRRTRRAAAGRGAADPDCGGFWASLPPRCRPSSTGSRSTRARRCNPTFRPGWSRGRTSPGASRSRKVCPTNLTQPRSRSLRMS